MADINTDSHPISADNKEREERQEPETGMAEADCSKFDGSNKDDHQNRDSLKDEEVDNKGAYTAGTRGFPPSRLLPRVGGYGGSTHIGGNPFAARPCINKSSLDGGQSSDSGPSLWPGLTPSKLGGSVGSGTGSPLSRPVLRPPQLSSPALASPSRTGELTPTRSTFPLNPPRLGNPFGKALHCDGDEAAEKSSKAEEPTTPAIPATSQVASTPSSTVRFMPLGTPTSTPSQDSSSAALPSTPASFVFGQNLHERVVESTPNHTSQTPSTSKQAENGMAEPGSSSTPTTNGTSAEMLFSAGLKEQGPESSMENGEPAKSLSEAAREYEESRSAVKRKYEQVAILTGEEDETNVLQVTAKLFAYDKGAGAWKERGHGQLRLNDKVEGRGGGTSPGGGGLQSRIIMRNFGSLRVVLNTKVWAGMVVDRASPASLRITAMDNDIIKVFLIKTSVKEAESLHTALERRVASQRQRVPAASESATPSSPPSQDVEEARLGVEASSLPTDSEPSSKKGRSSDLGVEDEEDSSRQSADAEAQDLDL